MILVQRVQEDALFIFIFFLLKMILKLKCRLRERLLKFRSQWKLLEEEDG